jgi:hypothetical protein
MPAARAARRQAMWTCRAVSLDPAFRTASRYSMLFWAWRAPLCHGPVSRDPIATRGMQYGRAASRLSRVACLRPHCEVQRTMRPGGRTSCRGLSARDPIATRGGGWGARQLSRVGYPRPYCDRYAAWRVRCFSQLSRAVRLRLHCDACYSSCRTAARTCRGLRACDSIATPQSPGGDSGSPDVAECSLRPHCNSPVVAIPAGEGGCRRMHACDSIATTRTGSSSGPTRCRPGMRARDSIVRRTDSPRSNGCSTVAGCAPATPLGDSRPCGRAASPPQRRGRRRGSRVASRRGALF